MKYKKKTILFTILFLLGAFLCFYKLGSPPLEHWDEQTNADVVEDILESEQFLTLIYESDEFFEKPPLWYWMTMISARLFGLSHLSLRIVSALAGFFSIIITALLGWRMFSPKAGLIAGSVMLGTRQLFVKHSEIFATHTFRSGDLDSLQILFILITFALFYKFFTNMKEKKWLVLAGISTGLAFLAKGPVSLIPSVAFLAYLMLNREKQDFPVTRIIKFCILHFGFFTLTTLPWHLFMFLKYGNEFLNEYFGYHLIGRGLTTLEGHQESPFYYVKLLFRKDFFFSGEVLIGSIIFLLLRYRRKILNDFPLFSCFAVSCLLLLTVSLVQTKLAWYLLPLYPFAAVIIGKTVDEIMKSKNRIFKTTVFGIILFAMGFQILQNLVLIYFI